jgi:hypothetical protein
MTALGDFSPGDILSADDLNAIGTWTSYTPVLSQSGVRSATVNYAEYCLINKVCFVNVDLTCTTTGSAGNVIEVTLPLACATNAVAVGSGQFFDSSASDVRLLTATGDASKVVFVADDSTTSRLGDSPSLALGNNDVISFNMIYRTV